MHDSNLYWSKTANILVPGAISFMRHLWSHLAPCLVYSMSSRHICWKSRRVSHFSGSWNYNLKSVNAYGYPVQYWICSEIRNAFWEMECLIYSNDTSSFSGRSGDCSFLILSSHVQGEGRLGCKEIIPPSPGWCPWLHKYLPHLSCSARSSTSISPQYVGHPDHSYDMCGAIIIAPFLLLLTATSLTSPMPRLTWLKKLVCRPCVGMPLLWVKPRTWRSFSKVL